MKKIILICLLVTCAPSWSIVDLSGYLAIPLVATATVGTCYGICRLARVHDRPEMDITIVPPSIALVAVDRRNSSSYNNDSDNDSDSDENDNDASIISRAAILEELPVQAFAYHALQGIH